MTAKLSVNINKIATLRNARGGNTPDVVAAAIKCQQFGAEGITVHPRPDERHIRYQDVRDLKPVITTEFNIEGKPIPSFVDLVLEVKPEQVTLVPDADEVITSNAGWDCINQKEELQHWVNLFQKEGIRVSVFIDPVIEQIEAAAKIQPDRIELYTEAYASGYAANKHKAIAPYIAAGKRAHELGLGVNAGHDLSLENLAFFAQNLPFLQEVSIGHALVSDALEYGMQNVVTMYKRLLVG